MTDRERLTQVEEFISEILQKQDRMYDELAHLTMKVAANSIDTVSLKKTVKNLEAKIDTHGQILAEHGQVLKELQSGFIGLRKDIETGQDTMKAGIETLLEAIKKGK